MLNLSQMLGDDKNKGVTGNTLSQEEPDAPDEPSTSANLLELFGGNAVETPEGIKYQKGYRHTQIAHFQIGEFHFRDHILTLSADTPEQLQMKDDAFLTLARGLEARDKVAITELRNIQNERPLMQRLEGRNTRGIRGSVSTSDIKAPIQGDNKNSQAGAVKTSA